MGTSIRALLAGAAALTATAGWLAVPLPAQAHGATTWPISRAVACSDQGGRLTSSAACRAANAVNGSAAANWDQIRVPDINGKDRTLIPDGKLCSGGLDKFAGLDLARTDWPTTKLTAGSSVSLRYRTTIPHAGQFRLYLTNSSYRPGAPLRWSSLASQPFLTVTDPPREGDAYLLRARLPNRTGRQLIYTVWENSSTPDTYYSCSDVAMTASRGAAAAAPRASRTPTATRKATPSAAAPRGVAAPVHSHPAPTPSPADLAASPVAQRSAVLEPVVLLAIGITAVGALGIAVIGGFAAARGRRRRPTAAGGPTPPDRLGRHRA